MNVSFSENKDTGIITCTIEDSGITVTAQAKCHPEDKPYYSTTFGNELAYARAEIKYCKKFIRNIYAPRLQTLIDIHHILYSSDKYNEASRRLVRRQIQITRHDIEIAKETIATLKQYVTGYINQKEKFNLRGKIN